MTGLIVGGLGGGGDVGLAAVAVSAFNVEEHVSAVVSFASCSGSSGLGEHVAGSLVKVKAWPSLGRRFFEDKLARIAWWAREVFIACVRAPWESLVEGLSWVYDVFKPSCMVGFDIGGDSLLLGYEDSLGSYKTDTVARAALAWLSERYNVRALIGVGGAGAEGGGGEISLVDLAAVLEYLESEHALLGSYVPPRESLWPAKTMLSMAESGMLPLYLQAVEDKKEARIDMAYLHGVYRIEPWYKYIVFVDAEKHCSLSPLCEAAKGRGVKALKKWEKPEKPPKLRRIYQRLKKADNEVLRIKLVELMERLRDKFDMRECL